jgi:hypothetical protein
LHGLCKTISFPCETYLVHSQRHTCAAQPNQKNPPSVQEGKRTPAMYAVYIRKHRRTDFLLLYLRSHCVCRQLRTCSAQASTTRYPSSRESFPVSILCEITLVKLVWNHMISHPIRSLCLFVCLYTVKQTLRTLALLPLLDFSI